jgi:hypothetical protein
VSLDIVHFCWFFSRFYFVAMKRLAVLFLFILVYSTSANNIRSPFSVGSLAIKVVIDNYFVRNVYELEIISFGLENEEAERTIDKLLGLEISSMPIRVTRNARELLQSGEFKLEKPSVLMFDSPENFHQNQQPIVYFPNATIDDIQVLSYKNHTIHKTIFLVNETRHSIELATAFMLTPEACYKNQFKVINRFTRHRKRWENSNFFVEKYSNFYGCRINVVFDGKLFDDVLNFTQQPGNYSESAFWIQFRSTSQITGNWDMFVVFMDSLKIFIPPGELYGDYEKMMLPHDDLTWIAIGVTIFVSCLAILVIRCIFSNLREIFFGRNNLSPLLEFISIIINGSQTRSVIGNAPRIFFLNAIFWSLIFR